MSEMNFCSSKLDDFVEPARPAAHRTRQALVRWGTRVVTVGGGAPVRVQAMTNTDTVDAIGTAIQVKELAIYRQLSRARGRLDPIGARRARSGSRR